MSQSQRMEMSMSSQSQHQVLGEDNICIHQYGRTEVPYVEVDGWTKTIPVSFPNLKEELKYAMKKEIYPQLKGNNLPQSWNSIQRGSTCLASLACNAGSYGSSTLASPIVVHVVAKSKCNVTFSDKNAPGVKKAFVFANALIADSSGVCLLQCTDEAVQTVFDRLDVGDVLCVRKAKYQLPYAQRNTSATATKLFHPFAKIMLKLEIKVDKYGARHSSFISMKDHPNWEPKLPEILINSCGYNNFLHTPSQMYLKAEKEMLNQRKKQAALALSPTASSSKSSSSNSNVENENFFDVLGIITYVGRLERNVCKITEDVLVHQGQNKNDVKTTITQFKAYRWIQIIDETSKPISLRVFIRRENGLLNNLLPGSGILITYCTLTPTDVFEPEEQIVHSTMFSMIYLNQDIMNYFRFMPKAYAIIGSREVLGIEAYRAIIQRQDISWAVGGTLHLPRRILEDKKKEFCKFFPDFEDEENDNDYRDKSPGYKSLRQLLPAQNPVMRDNERSKIYIRGKILQVVKVFENNSKIHLPVFRGNKICSLHPVIQGDFDFKANREKGHVDEVYRNHRSCICTACLKAQWQSLKFNIPPVEIPTNVTRTSDIINEITRTQMEKCKPILFPAMDGSPPITALQGLERTDKYNFLSLTIRDYETNIDYDVRWDSYPMAEMQRKCKEAEGKTIIAFVNLWKGQGSKNKICDEVILRDFVIWEDKDIIIMEVVKAEVNDDIDDAASDHTILVPNNDINTLTNDTQIEVIDLI